MTDAATIGRFIARQDENITHRSLCRHLALVLMVKQTRRSFPMRWDQTSTIKQARLWRLLRHPTQRNQTCKLPLALKLKTHIRYSNIGLGRLVRLPASQLKCRRPLREWNAKGAARIVFPVYLTASGRPDTSSMTLPEANVSGATRYAMAYP